LLVVCKLSSVYPFDPPPDPQRGFPGGPEVANPLSLAARRDQVATPMQLQRIDRSGTRLPAVSAAYRDYIAAEHADAAVGERGENTVERTHGPGLRTMWSRHGINPFLRSVLSTLNSDHVQHELVKSIALD